jgi:cell division protein FtsB
MEIAGMINIDKNRCKMKRILSLLLICLSLNCYSNAFASSNVTNQTKTINQNKDKVKTSKDVASSDAIEGCINDMKKDGWTYDGLVKNKDGSFTLFFSKNTKGYSYQPYMNSNVIIPDGTYISYLGNIVIENTYKNNKLVKQVVNGQKQEVTPVRK